MYSKNTFNIAQKSQDTCTVQQTSSEQSIIRATKYVSSNKIFQGSGFARTISWISILQRRSNTIEKEHPRRGRVGGYVPRVYFSYHFFGRKSEILSGFMRATCTDVELTFRHWQRAHSGGFVAVLTRDIAPVPPTTPKRERVAGSAVQGYYCK